MTSDYHTNVPKNWVPTVFSKEQLKPTNTVEERKVTRVEVIDNKGRSYVNWDDKNKVTLSYQDEGRTLKIFIDKPKQETCIHCGMTKEEHCKWKI